MQWIAASLAPLFPRNDMDRVVIELHTLPFLSTPQLVIARAESPWRSTVSREANRIAPYASIASSGLPRLFAPLFPRNDKANHREYL